ncbi:MAG: PD40 domain-containing protein [Bacteroidales bacterium]|nr:PD40 domain-containing protein [Bacteroidales bacterium]
MKNRLLSLSFVLLSAGVCSVQNVSAQDKEVVQEALTAFESSDWMTAAKNYKQLVASNPENPLFHSNLGYCYLQAGNKEQALTELNKAKNLYASSKNKIMAQTNEYYLGSALRQSDKIDEALSVLNGVKPQVSNKDLSEKIDDEIKSCNIAKELKANPKDVTVLNLGKFVNSASTEHSPIVSPDGKTLYFTSSQKVEGHTAMDDGNYDENIYSSKLSSETGTWEAPVLLEGNLANQYNSSVVCMSNDGKELYIYNDEKNGMILVSKKVGDSWGEPVALNANINTDYRETGATLSKDGNKLYFASNRPGGQGGLDLYVSERVNGDWGPAVNLGKTINTSADEEGPFIAPDGTLYFSSKGHHSLGGYDIFKSVLNGSKWSEPENLGTPMNTVDDEVYVFIDKSGKFYFASKRKKGCGEADLYVAGPKNLMEIGSSEYQGLVTLCDKAKLSQSLVRVRDNSTAEEFEVKPDDQTGNYSIKAYKGHNYSVSFEQGGDVIEDDMFDVSVNAPALTAYKTVKLDPGVECPVATEPEPKNLDDIKDKNEVVITLKDVRFEFASSKLESSQTLDELADYMNKNTNAEIRIIGYCDAMGKAGFNKELSKQRAEAAKDYLVKKKGVNARKLTTVGYGEENPITVNKVNGEINESAKQYNRRLEFEVVKQGEQKLIVLPLSVPVNYANPNYKSSGYKASKRNPETEI